MKGIKEMKGMKVMMLLTILTTLLAIPAEAKYVKCDHLYMIGFSASFKDSIIYVTDIQDVQGAWVDSKTKFLKNRDQYSYQLREHLSEQYKLPERICLVLFATKKKKAEKLYMKLMKKYKTGYDVKYLSGEQFKFEAIDTGEEVEEPEKVEKPKKGHKPPKGQRPPKGQMPPKGQ
jgi:hypothetical protein